jgi:hypothetical protein
MAEKPRKRVWVKTVDVSATELETRLAVAAARGLGPDQKAAADGARALLARARAAANRVDPRPGRWATWWRGAMADPAFQNLHAAMAQMVDVYDDAELLGEIQTAAAKQHVTTDRDDSRRIDPVALAAKPIEQQRAVLRRTIADSYATMDRRYEQIRSFRNIILLSAALLTVLLGITVGFVASSPKMLPLCFGDGTSAKLFNCPTGSAVSGPHGGDILLVALLGALGGALAASLAIRKLQGTSVPYDIPVALAVVKLPLGALTAILGLVAIRAAFLPGLSSLDSQAQIVAYALILGFAQQSFTTLLDSRAQDLLTALPATSGAAPGTPPPAAVVAPVPPLGAGLAPSIVDPAAAAGIPIPVPRVEFESAAAAAAPDGTYVAPDGSYVADSGDGRVYLAEPSEDDGIPTEDGSYVMENAIPAATP